MRGLKTQALYFACRLSPAGKKDDPRGVDLLEGKQGEDEIFFMVGRNLGQEPSRQEEGCLRGLHAKNKSASAPYFSSWWSSLFCRTKPCIANQ